MIVVDASVAFQWVLPDEDESAAKALLFSGERILAPSILKLEITSAISRRFREGHLSESSAKTACNSLAAILGSSAIHLIPMDEVWDVSLALSFKAKHAFADCLYLAVGKSMNEPVVTADKNMAIRGKKAGVEVVLLAEAQKRWPWNQN